MASLLLLDGLHLTSESYVLSGWSAPLCLVAVLIASWISSCLASRHLHLTRLPGPRLAAYTRYWLFSNLHSEALATVNKQFGPLVRVGPNHLLTDDPDLIRKMQGVHSLYERSESFDAFILERGRTNLINERNRLKHAEMRTKMAAGWSGLDIVGMEAIIDERLREWIGYVDRHGITAAGARRDPFGIGASISYFTLEVIVHLAFGQPLGFVRNHRDIDDYPSLLVRRLPVVERVQVIPELVKVASLAVQTPWLNRPWVGKIIGITLPLVNQCYERPARAQNDMISSFMRRGIDRGQVESEATMIILAGFHTPATAIRAVLFYLLTSPNVHRRLRDEIDTAFAHKGAIPLSDALAMPFLQACIKESLRLFPPVVQLRERTTPPGGDTLAGYAIPGGTKISVNQRGLLMNEVFGPDASTFRPERWLDADPKRLSEMERVWELSFGWGATRCLGLRIATVTINRFLVEVLRRYDLELANPPSDWASMTHAVSFPGDMLAWTARRDGQSSGGRESESESSPETNGQP